MFYIKKLKSNTNPSPVNYQRPCKNWMDFKGLYTLNSFFLNKNIEAEICEILSIL